MESAIRILASYVFYTDIILNLLALAGAWAVLWWSIDNFRSIFEIILSVLSPYFQPQEHKSLVERYGKWAGEKSSTSLKDVNESFKFSDLIVLYLVTDLSKKPKALNTSVLKLYFLTT